MDIFLSITAIVLSLIGLAGCIIPVLPGTVLSYGGLLCGFFCSYSTIDPVSMWIWLAVSLAVIAADFFFPAMMTKAFGGTRAGAIGATVGIFLGLTAGPVGIILGPFFGAVVGELLHDKRDPATALKVGFGSFAAFIVGTGLKLITSIWMLAILLHDMWSPLKEWFVELF